MNVPLSKELGLFIIAAISATHDELCLSKIQNSIFERAANPMIVARRSGSATWPPRLKTFHQGGRSWTGMRGFQSNTIKHTI
jgi:hypothetical protein